MGSCTSSITPEIDVREIFRIINDIDTFRSFIDYTKKMKYMKHVYTTLKCNNVIGGDDTLTTCIKPFNVFAMYASGKLSNNVDQTILGTYANDWMICHNKPECDTNWSNVNDKVASMCGPDENGPGHVFITTKNLHWKYFNILPIVYYKDVTFLLKLKEVAMHYTKQRGWRKAGFYFHCYPHNTVNSLHLHVCNEDERYVGHRHEELKYKNLSLDAAIKVASE